PPCLHSLSLHDALPISFSKGWAALGGTGNPGCGRRDDGHRWDIVLQGAGVAASVAGCRHVYRRAASASSLDRELSVANRDAALRSEEHTSELQSPYDLV